MADITLLDGGMGQELVRRSGGAPNPLWSTQILADSPELVTRLHEDFFSAGATIATAVTYSIHRDRLVGTPLDDQFEVLLGAAMDAAISARPVHGRVAGSIGPLAATYRPDRHPESAEAIPNYAEFARLIAPKADLIICETVASLLHAETILEGARVGDKPVWLSVTVSDTDGGRLRSGEPVGDIIPIAQRGGAEAILVNCSAPEAIEGALVILADSGLPLGAYANGFVRITEDFLKDRPTSDALQARRDITPEVYADFVMGWIPLGATIVGGCCEIGPGHIAEIALRLRDAGHRIV